MIKVTLVDFTGANFPNDAMSADWAATMLIFAKSTRLTMSPSLLKDILDWPQAKKEEELKYIANTIPASHEFVNMTFMIEGVSRAFTHQWVRNRHCSHAQQTMRVLNKQGWDYTTGPSLKGSPYEAVYDEAMAKVRIAYDTMVSGGVAIEDARGVLPTNITTNILTAMNLRTFTDIIKKRSSPRTQGEYREVLEQMKAAVEKVYPWIHLFTNRTFHQATKELDTEIKALDADPVTTMKLMKLVDLLRREE